MVLYTLALVAIYMLYSGTTGLIAFGRDVSARAPSVVAYTGDVVVLPAAVAVLLLAALEFFKPAAPTRDSIAVLALIFFAGSIALPIAFRLGVGALLPERGYMRCAGGVADYTFPASRWVLDPALCRPTPLVAL